MLQLCCFDLIWGNVDALSICIMAEECDAQLKENFICTP